MTTLTIQPQNLTVEAEPGTPLLKAILDAGIELLHKCGGKAQCGGCHLYVQEGRKSLSKTQRLENEQLDAIVGVSSKSRLACQAQIGTEPVTVELLGFKSGF